jgi:hypothetical protein
MTNGVGIVDIGVFRFAEMRLLKQERFHRHPMLQKNRVEKSASKSLNF